MNKAVQVCIHCGEHKSGRMRYRQCMDCYNARRKARYRQDPQYRLRRQQERDVGVDRDKRNERQARYRQRERAALEVHIHLHPQKEIQPVKLPPLFWHLLGNRVVVRPEGPYGPTTELSEHIRPDAFLARASQRIKLRRFRGVNYPDITAYLGNNRYGHFREMTFRDPDTGRMRQVNLFDEPFFGGDCIAIQSREIFRVPPFVRLLAKVNHEMLFTTSVSAEPALMEPGEHAPVRLVLHFEEAAYMLPTIPLISVEAHLGKAVAMSLETDTVISYRKAQ